jgi:signal transduction histidine kinase
MRTAEARLQRLLEGLARERRELLRGRSQLEEVVWSLDRLTAGIQSASASGEVVESLADVRRQIEGLRGEWTEGWSGRLGSLVEAAEELKQELSHDKELARLGELSASVAHEIRNPLCGILLSLEVLQTRMDPGDSRVPLLENLHREAEKMEKIVNNLLHFARHYQPRLVRCELAEVVQRSIASVKAHLNKNGMAVMLRPSAVGCEAEVDADMVQQVFNNILLNSVDACPKGSTLDISLLAEQGPSQVAVAFRDEGAGIGSDILGRIFEPFFTSKPNGIGLGLSVSRKIVEAHNGTIEVCSEPGKGTTFTVVFPRASDRQHARVAA